MKSFIAVSYGGGVNSVAMLCGWIERALPTPDVILFSDTGGERPETYRHIQAMSDWLTKLGYPTITRLRKVKADHVTTETLEQNCLDHSTLPSLAYGFKRCSMKFKRQPSEKFLNNHAGARAVWKQGRHVMKLIGFDADEAHRAERAPRTDKKYEYRYPLIDWGWDREECVAAIQRAGLQVPPKSSCFFCPAMTKPEILALRDEHPKLLARALRMEQNARANFQSVKGLGRRFSWAAFLAGEPVAAMSPEIDCECYDG